VLNELRQQVSSGLLLRFSPALLTKGQCKLSLREIKNGNFHAVKLIGHDKKLHVMKSNLRSFVFLSAAATLNKSNKRKICKRISTIVES